MPVNLAAQDRQHLVPKRDKWGRAPEGRVRIPATPTNSARYQRVYFIGVHLLIAACYDLGFTQRILQGAIYATELSDRLQNSRNSLATTYALGSQRIARLAAL